MLLIMNLMVMKHYDIEALNVCNYLNNILDYIAKEKPDYLIEHWDSKNVDELRIALERYT